MVVVNKGDAEFYIDERLSEKLEKVVKKVNTKDEDYFWAVDGEEGGGKSVLAMQLAKYVDPTFCLDRVVFTGKEFKEAILKAKKGQAIVFDEAFRGLSSRGALTEINKLLVGLMMECRQKNLIVFVVMPTFFLLDKYVAIWRAKGLFHVYRPGGKRGYWVYFNKRKKKLLYLKGRATYSYDKPKSEFSGRFLEQYVLDEQAYRDKKRAALNSTARNTKHEGFMEQRNLLLWFMNRELSMSTTEISRRCTEMGWEVSQETVSESIVRKEHDLKEQGFLL